MNCGCKKNKNESSKSQAFGDSVQETNLGTSSSNPDNAQPGTLEDDVRLINPDEESLESRG